MFMDYISTQSTRIGKKLKNIDMEIQTFSEEEKEEIIRYGLDKIKIPA